MYHRNGVPKAVNPVLCSLGDNTCTAVAGQCHTFVNQMYKE